MKTILYQPIFINPQAYFVFPSLYHIEKGDSFIEPANITGQLIINTLTDDPTLTPIILTVKDNNQVDFSIFAGKHIRISQYTDEGAVVLGEWLMPGESAPVYPDWFNDSLVCWYSPSKQKLTQLDVIESYAEDFTYWTINNTSITSTQKKIVIPAGTELKYVIAYRDFNGFTDGFHIKYTGNAVITYRYNKEDGTVGTIAIDKSGIYHLPASVRAQKNFGFYCNPQTVTEEATIEQLPTSILKDFSGNGLDAYMYGFQGKLNSGVGIYSVDFTTYNNSGNQVVVHGDYDWEIRMSLYPLEGYTKFSKKYCSAYEAYRDGSTLYSIRNQVPTVSTSRTTFLTQARNDRSNSYAIYTYEIHKFISQITKYTDRPNLYYL